MTFFDDMLQKGKEIADVASKKTSDFIDVTRLRLQASDMEKELASILEGLGRLVYDSRKADEDVSEMIDDCIVKIDEQQAALDALRVRIDEYRSVVRCPACGTVNAEDAVYCKQCARKIL